VTFLDIRCKSYEVSKVNDNLVLFFDSYKTLKFNNFHTKGLNDMKQSPCTPPHEDLSRGTKCAVRHFTICYIPMYQTKLNQPTKQNKTNNLS